MGEGVLTGENGLTDGFMAVSRGGREGGFEDLEDGGLGRRWRR